MRFFYTVILLAVCFASTAQVIPNDLIVSREPRPELKVTERGPFTLASLSNGTIQQVFETPPCQPGEYYVAFQLYYDLGNTNTEVDWTADIKIAFLNDTTTQWTKVLSLQNITQTGPSPSQTFVQTAFHSTALTCNPNYKIKVRWKNPSVSAPQNNISLKFIFYKKEDYVANPFNPATTGTLTLPSTGGEENLLSWNYTGHATVAYDVEWVYIATHETKYTGSTAVSAFQFKEPARVTVASAPYIHSAHYPNGKLWYRVRAVGYNPLYPEHRINGTWFYGPDGGLDVANHAEEMTWQSQTVYAEQGKYKKTMTYYDGTLRQRQQQTNLSTSGDTTLVRESMYDYEGRASVSVMAVPSASTSLSYKPSFNVFETSTDATVATHTSTTKTKFNYDNAGLPNSIMASSSGASKYYSPANDLVTFRRNYIPDAEGYVYSQKEYTNDGTGKVSRASGVGKEFRMDGPHMSKYYYGQATQRELRRLFGSNVGKAAHYKKNLVVDNNGQVNVSYLDQEGRVIATALAGTKPSNVASLPSYDALDVNEVEESLIDKNLMVGGSKVVSHKILNVAVNTEYVFNYDFSATGPLLSEFGCTECSFDIKITITDPDGKLMNINSPTTIPGNQAPDDYSYTRSGVSVAECLTTGFSIEFPVLFQEIGDYTITKILTPHNTTYIELRTSLETHPTVLLRKQRIGAQHVIDSASCDICTSNCPETDSLINQTINEIAIQDCENKLRLIIQALRDQNPNNPDYEPTQLQIEAHPDFCDYELCLATMDSEIFEKQLARAPDWSEALNKNYDDLADVGTFPFPDPFFRPTGLGSPYTASLQDKLNNIFVATIAYDSDLDGEEDGTQDYYGTIMEIINPLNPNYYIDENGNATNNVNNGEHMLYLDIMRRFKDGYMNVTEYNNELNQTQWTYFKSFYLEAKRKTKLEIAQFEECPAAKSLLELPGTLPLTEGGVKDYGDEHDATEPISTPELENYFASFKFTCENKHIAEEDSLAIINHLISYFNGRPPGLFKFILTPDVNLNPDLIAIQEILDDYDCGQLMQFADTDPFSCAKDTTITYRNKYVPQNGNQALQMMMMEEGRVSDHEFDVKISENTKRRMAELEKERTSKMDEDLALQRDARGAEILKTTGANARKTPGPTKSLVTTTAEYNALMDFYNAMGGPNWNIKTGWGDPNASVWYGVTQDVNGHIKAINLDGNNLVGSIPSSFSNLTYLESLGIGDNNLGGAFPSVLLSIPTLKYLFIRNNQFTGTLGSITSSLTNLVLLWASGNSFSGSIPGTISNLTNLQTLYLDYNQLTGAIPSAIGSLPALRFLDLSNNQLTGSIPTTIGLLTNLEELAVRGNGLSGSIPDEIEGCIKIRYFYGNENDLTGSIPTTIDALKKLERLNLSSNELSGSIPVEIGGCEKLQWLTLHHNNLTGNIPSTIGSLTNLEDLDVSSNQLSGTLPVSIGSLTKLQSLSFGGNQLTGSLPNEIGNLTSLQYFSCGQNLLTGPIPSSTSSWSQLRWFIGPNNDFTGTISFVTNWELAAWIDIAGNEFSGSIPASIGNLEYLGILNLAGNDLTGTIPPSLGDLNVSSLTLSGNLLTGTIPSELASNANLSDFNVGGNKLTGKIPTSFASLSSLFGFVVSGNRFTFSDILPVKQAFNPLPFSFYYLSQDSVDQRRNISAIIGETRRLVANVDRSTSPASTYQWFQYVNGTSDIALNTESSTGHTVMLTNIQLSDHGKRYYYKIKNTDATALTLTSRMRKIVVDTSGFRTAVVCLEQDTTNATYKKFAFKVKWSEIIKQCLDSAAKERTILVQIAVDRVIDSLATEYLVRQTTQCLDGVTEELIYSFTPREHHYTLYYFDQAGNLVQTVPPEGAHPTSGSGQSGNPAHTMITRYQYNSLNQVIWQKTPDGGETQFWHNEKGQLRLTQNAQQFIDGHYSYNKYDEQGRVIEAGQLTSSNLNQLLAQMESASFPTSPTYALTDITKTHYDFVDPVIQSTFIQSNVRNRVAWVEVLEDGQLEPVVTYYSYDIHGSVKSLLQHVPGLDSKRTDYAYDLSSGNVNYVFYQYGASDQFIHKYTYDAENRLYEVFTSNDGYMWDNDARYKYYLHGKLARVELGHHRVQGMDYYYTLQGWTKGVNMPFAGDPGNDGYAGTNLRVARDVFAYTLGYFENDYKTVGSSVTFADSRDQLWTRYKSLMGSTNTGLYNANISWMTTDLKKIGQLNGARRKGMQATVYHYDQLNRIRQNRSLAAYTPGSGFDSRASSPAVYDEDFTYDGNGNILTLQRRDQAGAIMDDFVYDYYAGTNRLQYHELHERDTAFTGAINTATKLFRNVVVGANAYVPAGNNVILKAINNIDFDADPGVDLQSDATFRAYIIGEDDGVYNYDAIGNLIADQDNGVRIEWTPFGKVKKITRANGLVTSFRYDAAGNRVESKIVSPSETKSTTYIRDADGNVMGVYDDAVLSELSVFGSKRLGVTKQQNLTGERKLGNRNYELGNHLGNVLSVITDNIRMSPDSTFTFVVASSDYYAFGSDMAGRTWQKDYRYGFNGKEKDDSGEFGDMHYDYGFRIYNPKLSRFLSVDPIAKQYPELTPYQFASNTPIQAIDMDGLEMYLYHLEEDKSSGTPKLKVKGEADIRDQFHINVEFVNSADDSKIGDVNIPQKFSSYGIKKEFVYYDDRWVAIPDGYSLDKLPAPNDEIWETAAPMEFFNDDVGAAIAMVGVLIDFRSGSTRVGQNFSLIQDALTISRRARLSKRLLYMGRTPGKSSTAGQEVIARMRGQNKVKGTGDNIEFQASDGKWYPLKEADMAHGEDAVKFWNRIGRFLGPRHPIVLKWMKFSGNYTLEHFKKNRSDGARLNEQYLDPVSYRLPFFFKR